MHMVGHDDKGMDEIVFLIEEPYGIGNNGLHTFVGNNAQFKQKQRKVKMREMNCKWLRMSNIS